MLGLAVRVLLSFALVISLWSGVMAAPLSGTAMNRPICCHARQMDGHAQAQGDCGCGQDAPCRMQANPYVRVFPALQQGNAEQVPLALLPTWPLDGRLISSAGEPAIGLRLLLKPPGRLYILNAKLLI